MIELGAIVALCFLLAGSPPPAVNEAHYLAKAKHYWNPDWCPGDFFLDSSDAHRVFYWVFGWTTLLLPLSAAAWVGRFLVWTLLACAWRSIVRRLCPAAWAPLLGAMLLLPLTYYGHLSGEWLVGGVEAKGFAYPLVFWAMASAVERRWWCVWPLLGAASSFHVLVGGWAVVAFLFAWYARRREDELRLASLAAWLCIGGLCALPGLLPALSLGASATTAELREACRIYTFRRLAHHLVFQEFAWQNLLRFGLLVWAWWKVSAMGPSTERLLRLRAIVLGSVLILAAGVALDFLTGPFPGVRAGILRYYWFRQSDIFVPLGLAVALVSLRALPRRRGTDYLLAGAFLAAAIGIGWAAVQTGPLARSTALQQQQWPALRSRGQGAKEIDQQWRQACSWIRDHAPRTSVFLTPTRQQTFKWFAGRAEIVTWKDVPQDPAGLIAWWQRRQEVYLLGDWPWHAPDHLANLIQRHGVTHVIWRRPAAELPTPGAKLLFRNDSFVVYDLHDRE